MEGVKKFVTFEKELLKAYTGPKPLPIKKTERLNVV